MPHPNLTAAPESQRIVRLSWHIPQPNLNGYVCCFGTTLPPFATSRNPKAAFSFFFANDFRSLDVPGCISTIASPALGLQPSAAQKRRNIQIFSFFLNDIGEDNGLGPGSRRLGDGDTD